MIKEINLFGVFLPPLFGHLAAAALVWLILRLLLRITGVYRFVMHPPLFNFALYVIVLGALFATTF
ncbi:MAG: DUF1656 domain-containing protein [Alphaproteobacteria bacterium]|nr:DUF1656 domain-containing protein [Alphaproteobacteria bacterium]